MRALVPLLASALLGCGEKGQLDDTQAPVDTQETGAPEDTGETGLPDDSDTEPDPKAVGRQAMDFEMEDINPSSPSYGTMVSSEDLAGTAYGLLFMDSRCVGCIDLADDVWALLVEHPQWHSALPIFGVQSFSAYRDAAATIGPMVENNDLPYLVDLEHNSVWAGYEALNHDLIVFSADGLLEAWLPLYSWPEDMEALQAYLEERFDEGG
jgi:predicted small lipoprotein YifL